MADHEHFTIEEIETALRASGGFLSGASKKLGCCYQTIINYAKKHPELQAIRDEIDEAQLDFSESKLLAQIKDGNITAIIFHLKCKGKKRGYIEKYEYENPNRLDTDGYEDAIKEATKRAFDDKK